MPTDTLTLGRLGTGPARAWSGSTAALAWRNLWRNRWYTTTNLLGLTTGLSACLLIFLFIRKIRLNSFHLFKFGSGLTVGLYEMSVILL